MDIKKLKKGINTDINIEESNMVSIDVSLDELKNMGKKSSFKILFDFLYKFWVGKSPEREHDIRIGTIDVYKNADGNLKIDFTTRFTLEEDVAKMFPEREVRIIDVNSN